jgi:hypothetical protein
MTAKLLDLGKKPAIFCENSGFSPGEAALGSAITYRN